MSTVPLSDGAPAETGIDAPQELPVPPQYPAPRWLVRVELFLRVVLRIYVGLATCYAPWSHSLWNQNPIFLAFPALGSIAAIGAVRGIVTGLGLLNLWIALQDAFGARRVER